MKPSFVPPDSFSVFSKLFSIYCWWYRGKDHHWLLLSKGEKSIVETKRYNQKYSRLRCLLYAKVLVICFYLGLVWQYSTNQNQYNKGMLFTAWKHKYSKKHTQRQKKWFTKGPLISEYFFLVFKSNSPKNHQHFYKFLP